LIETFKNSIITSLRSQLDQTAVLQFEFGGESKRFFDRCYSF